MRKGLFSATFLFMTVTGFAQNRVVTVDVETPGTLSERVLDLDVTRIKSLTVTGNLNGSDIAYLNSGTGKMSGVETLDISNIKLIAGDEPYATVVIARSDIGMGKTTAIFYIGDVYSETSDSQNTGLGGVNITKYIHTNDLSGAFAYSKSSDSSCSIKEVILPRSLPRIGDYMFKSNTYIERIGIPSGVTEIGKAAFEAASSLTSVNLPAGVKIVDDYAFSRSGLAQIDLPESLTVIGAEAFRETKLIGELDFSNVERLGMWAFWNVKISGTLNLGKLTEIPDGAFTGGDYDKVIFSDNLVAIGEGAFANSKLTDVTLPASLTSICASSFQDTPWYSSLKGADDGIIYINDIALAPTQNVKIVDGLLAIKDGTRSIASGNWNINDGNTGISTLVTRLELPSTLETIGDEVFSGFEKLGDITLPEGLAYIGDRAFNGCKSLWFENLPSSVLNIGEEAFNGCKSLTQIALSENVKSVGNNAFYGCSGISLVKIFASDLRGSGILGFGSEALDRVVIGGKLQYLPEESFFNSTNLRKVEFEPRDPATPLFIGGYCFSNCGKAQFVNFPERIDSIADYAFSDCAALSESLVLTDTRHIGYRSFIGCSSLTEVVLPESVEYIGEEAFGRCGNLQRVEYNCISATTGTVFRECDILAAVKIGKNVEKLGDGLFSTLSSLNSVEFEANGIENDSEIPSSFEIGQHCFSASGFKKIELPRNTTVIGDYAFADGKFAEITLPAMIKYLGKEMFSSSRVKNITILAEEVPEAGGNLWYSDVEAQSVVFHVPARLINDYRGAEIWKNYHYEPIEKLVEKIEISSSSVTLEEGSTLTLSVTVSPADADNQDVAWKSDNEGVVTVDNNGVVTAVAPGTATVTVSTLDGSNLSTNCVITVVKPVVLVESITLDVTEATMNVGDTMMLTATVLPEDADNREVTWLSGNEDVVTVDNNGVVTAVAPGTATVTVSTLDGSNLSATCNITVESKTGGVDAVGAESINVIARDGVIIISGTSEEAFIYSMTGMLIRRTDERRIEGLVSGCYFVFVGGQSFKVMI